MILEVLSGEKPVTDAIEQAKISRGHYYQLEERALKVDGRYSDEVHMVRLLR